MAFELIGKAVRRFRLPAVNYGNAPIIIVSAQEGDVKSRYFDITLYDDYSMTQEWSLKQFIKTGQN